MADGYYIEAIALQDSMISDRLEGLLGMLKQNVTMNSLGQLAQLSRALDPAAFGDLADRVLYWADRRNVVIHQMVKVGPTYHHSWPQRVALARRTAVDGLALLDAVDTAVSQRESGSKDREPTAPDARDAL